ncbi:MAG: hypothetical protein R2709_15550 [Marmoricola sp.]
MVLATARAKLGVLTTLGRSPIGVLDLPTPPGNGKSSQSSSGGVPVGEFLQLRPW